MKDKVKQVLIKTSYIIFSLLVAVALWMFVEITDNVLQTRDISIRDDQIILKNRELLGSRELLVSSILTENLVLTFEGTRRDITDLISAADEVMIEIDLESIRTAGTWTLNYEEVLPESLNSSSLSILRSTSSHIVVIIDRLLRRDFNVEVEYTGGTASADLTYLQPVYEPQVISISGPEEFVSQIARVEVPIVAANLSSTYSDNLNFILTNEDGEDLNADLHIPDVLTFSQDTIYVTIPVKQLRVLPLTVLLAHGATTSDANVTVTIEPREITVMGEPGDIDINSIAVGTIDTTTFGYITTTPRTFAINLPDYLQPVSGETEATVTVETHNLSVEIRSVTNLYTDNVPPGFTATIVTQALDVRIRGNPNDLAQVTADNIMISADLTDYSTGTHQVVARSQIIGTNAVVDIITNPEIRFYVTISADTP